MTKLLLFSLLWMFTGNPLLAIILILVVYYLIDRRFIGLTPSIIKPLRRMMHSSDLQRQLTLNPHDMPAKYDLAQTFMARHQYQRGLSLLESLPASMRETAEVLYDTGLCHLALRQVKVGEELVLRALNLDNKLRYGEPYLKLATALASSNPAQALLYLKDFQTKNFSSCESYYRLAQLQKQFGRTAEANHALRQCLETYRSLPKFRKRTERRWALLARLKLIFGR